MFTFPDSQTFKALYEKTCDGKMTSHEIEYTCKTVNQWLAGTTDIVDFSLVPYYADSDYIEYLKQSNAVLAAVASMNSPARVAIIRQALDTIACKQA